MAEDFSTLGLRLPPSASLLSVRSGRHWTAAGIAAETARRAMLLSASGLARGDRVVVAEADPAEVLLAIFACWRAGLCVVAVNPALAPAEQQTVIEATGARAWLGELRVDLPAPASAGTTSPVPLGPDEPALILMTSGTTGRPKGIAHSGRSLAARITLNIAAIGAGVLAETLCVLPVFFGHGLIGNALTPLFAGGRVHLWPTPTLAELPGLGPYLDANAISFMSSVPSFWKLATRVSPRPATPLARIHVGSAPLSFGQWQQIAAWGGTDKVFNMFGMTETANWIGGAALAEADGRDGYIGPAWGGAFAVRTEAGAIAGSGRGEVLLRSPSMMLGYWRRPDLDADAFVDGWFRTGDTGELAADG
ncbi:MAG TPA: AMP-binding protein, partial [Devosia sp.]|nr:AMP-binding protein [Devosia sp.]